MARQQTGVALIETLIVTALTITMSAVALPTAAAAMENYRFEEAMNMLAAEISQARQAAMTHGCEYQVAVSGTNYQLNVEPAGATSFSLAVNNEALTLPPGVSLGYGTLTAAAGDSGEQTGTQSGPSQSSAISFNSLGLPVNASGVPLAQNAFYLTDGSQYGAITVALSGRVQRWSWRGSSWVLE